MASSAKRPNFLIILADDLGYSDISPFGGEIDTPCLNKLANEGVKLSNFHTASACSPTRSMLFSGTDNHVAGLGQMTEHMAPDAGYKNRPGYEGYLNFKVAALSEILQDAGYHTVMSGKWHLGVTKETAPCSRGFDDSFVFLSGCGNHFNYEPQLEKPSDCLFTPMNAGQFWMQNDQYLDRTRDLPAEFYSTNSFTDRLIKQLSNRKQDSEGQDRPFFAYLPFTAPHWPLQAPKQLIEKYRGMYDDGPQALLEKRLQRLKDLKLVSPEVQVPAMTGIPKGEKAWQSMSPQERAQSARKMEVFAAMVESIDQNVGRIIDHLRTTDELDNTFIFFASDNGAEGAMLEAMPIMGGEDSVNRIINHYYNNAIDNMGAHDSYIWYGAEWACAAMAPSRGFKTWITEGGIRCPCIVRYPAGISKDLELTNSFATIMDVLPTVLDIAGVPIPGSRFRNRDVVPIRGSSWLPHLAGAQPSFHDEEEEITGWELFGLKAIRQGRYKALWMGPPRGKGEWELYDMSQDPGETRDLAEDPAFQDVLDRLRQHWERYYFETGMFEPNQKFKYVEVA